MPAPPERVWAWLIRAPLWPSWYPNPRVVRTSDGARDLALGVRFTWRTFGVSLRSTVLEFVPPERIAWDAQGRGVDAYHAWLIEPAPAGARIVTEETQHGWLARLNQMVLPKRMHRLHQVWLEELGRVARGGGPPDLAGPGRPG